MHSAADQGRPLLIISRLNRDEAHEHEIRVQLVSRINQISQNARNLFEGSQPEIAFPDLWIEVLKQVKGSSYEYDLIACLAKTSLAKTCFAKSVSRHKATSPLVSRYFGCKDQIRIYHLTPTTLLWRGE